MKLADTTARAWAIFFARSIVGFIFFMAGAWKTFQLGPLTHARQLFVEPYAPTFLPTWSLWATGVVVPVVELIAGGLVILGLRTREATIALGGVLVFVTFGPHEKRPCRHPHLLDSLRVASRGAMRAGEQCESQGEHRELCRHQTSRRETEATKSKTPGTTKTRKNGSKWFRIIARTPAWRPHRSSSLPRSRERDRPARAEARVRISVASTPATSALRR